MTMDYKKRYKQALERARYYHSKDYMLINSTIENIFPELKESGEELTWLTKYIEEEAYSLSMDIRDNEDRLKLKNLQRSLAWLEKQVEKKPYEWHSEDEQNLNAVLAFIEDEYLRRWLKDIIHVEYDQCSNCINDKGCVTCKVEPIFMVGDCVISNDGTHTYLVKERKRGTYVILDIGEDKEYCIDIETADRTGRLWTIQDAKDGDMLVASDGSIFLFAGVVDYSCKYYAALTTDNYVKINKEAKGGYWETSRAVYPATKEQRDLLFHKMKESGYEWDSKNKELKKIESKKLDPDKVIAWLVANIIDFEYYVKLFKKDFGL